MFIFRLRPTYGDLRLVDASAGPDRMCTVLHVFIVITNAFYNARCTRCAHDVHVIKKNVGILLFFQFFFYHPILGRFPCRAIVDQMSNGEHIIIIVIIIVVNAIQRRRNQHLRARTLSILRYRSN